MNIYVGNLDFKVTEEELESLFGEFGTVESAKLIIDKYSGRSKGFGFVIMDNQEEANAAIQELHEKAYKGRDMVVNEARPRRESY